MSAAREGGGAAREGWEVLGAEWVALPLKTPTLPPATHTNTHILGRAALTVIDPASPYPEAQAALEAALESRLAAARAAGWVAPCGGPPRVARVLLTHHHPDHVGGVERLRARFGVEVWAHPLTAARLSSQVDHLVCDGDEVPIDGEALRALTALHTPGHAAGHLCFVHLPSGQAMVGDMLAGEGTILIDPGEGDMGVYLAQLERLHALGLRTLWPSHGGPLEAAEALPRYLAHRRARERRVLEALRSLGGWRALSEVVELAYADAPAAARAGSQGGVAGRSAWAHLAHLTRLGLVAERPAPAVTPEAPPAPLLWRAAALTTAPYPTPSSDLSRAFEALAEVMARLRAECPWVGAQTLLSLRRYLAEEAAEVLEALELPPGDAATRAHRDELGDVLLQVVFQARIREEEGAFDLAAVARGLTAKLVRRHPHVFGDAVAASAEEVRALWAGVKAQERASAGAQERVAERGLLSAVPRTTPPLLRAELITTLAATVGFDWPTVEGSLNKVLEEREEVLEALGRGDAAQVADELGDLLFAALNACRSLKVDAAAALHGTCDRFTARFEGVERRAAARGWRLGEASLEQLDALWEEEKRARKGQTS